MHENCDPRSISRRSKDELSLLVFANWTVLALEEVFISMYRISRVRIFRFNSKTQWQMFLFNTLRPPYLCPWEGHKHGVSIQSSITLPQITREWKTAKTWFLAMLLIYQWSIVSQILDLHWTVTIFSFYHMAGENRELRPALAMECPTVKNKIVFTSPEAMVEFSGEK